MIEDTIEQFRNELREAVLNLKSLHSTAAVF